MSSTPELSVPSEWAGNIGYQITATAIAFLIVDVIFLGVRLASRIVTKARSGWDDWLLIPSGIFNIALCALVLYDTHNVGLGQHETAVYLEDPDALTLFAKLQLVFTAFYACCCLFPKLVILVLYLRIFTDRVSRMAVYVLMAISVVYFVLAIVITMTMCVPISAIWDPLDTSARCINLFAWWAYGTVPNVIIDFATLLLPIPTVLKLKLPLRDRVGLIFTFTAGGIGTIGAIARVVLYTTINGVTDDVTWSGVPLGIASMVEVTLYLVAACLPGLRPLYLYTRRQGQYSLPKSKTYADSDGQLVNRAHTYRMDSVDTARTPKGGIGKVSNSSLGEREYAGDDQGGYGAPAPMQARGGMQQGGYYDTSIQVTRSYHVR